MKTTIGVAELKATLSSVVKRVKSGGQVLITERGVPVAKLSGLDARELKDSRRERLARAGILRLGRGRKRKSLLRAPAGKSTGAAVLRALLEERRLGR